MRTVLIGIAYVIICILSLPLLLIECVVRLINQRAAAVFAIYVVRAAFNLALFISGCRCDVRGIENIPKGEAVLFAANHRSFYDIILAYSTIAKAGNQVAFVSKKEIKSFPIIAQWMYFLNCQFMDRDDMKQSMQVIKNCINLIGENYSIYIAPEGTRNDSDTLLEFKEGSMRIATKTGVPVIPICIKDTEKILENHLPWIHKGNISIEYGKPIYTKDLDRDEKKHLGAHVREIVQNMYDAK